MRGTRLRKWMLCGLLGAMLLATVGCEDRAALIELGARFLPEIGMYKAFGSTGDASLDAIDGRGHRATAVRLDLPGGRGQHEPGAE
jgi:hypothetical protein